MKENENLIAEFQKLIGAEKTSGERCVSAAGVVSLPLSKETKRQPLTGDC